MSRPKIGSVTRAPSGENGTRWIQSRTVSQAEATEPPMARAMSTRARPGPRRRAASGRAGRSASKVTTGAVCAERSRPPTSEPPARPVARMSAAWAASLTRSMSDRNEPRRSASGGGVSRPASHRLPSRTTRRQHEGRRRTGRAVRADPRPEDGVEADAGEPQRVGPEVEPTVNRMKSAMSDEADDDQAEAPAGPCRAIPSRRRRSGRPAGGGRDAAAARAARSAVGGSSSGPSPRRRVVTVGSSASAILGVGVGVVVGLVVRSVVRVRRRVGPRRGALRGPRVFAARGGFAPAQLLEEIVEQVAHRPAESTRYRLQGRWRPSTAGGTRPGRSRRARSGASPRPARARSGTRHGPPAATRHGRVGSSGGAIWPSRSWSRPPSSRISPGQRAADRRTETAERRIGRRPGGRGDVAEADDPSSSATQRIASHQPSGASEVGTSRRAGSGRRCGPRARAGTMGPARAGVRARISRAGPRHRPAA